MSSYESGETFALACDMTSDTCSDGRTITTTRSTPVPCEVSPGVWEMVPEDTGCYSVRGLESWRANTSYLSYGAELDREPWGPLRSGTIEKLSDGYRITSAAGQSQPSGRIQVLSPQETEGPVSLSCVVRTQSPLGRLTLEAGTGVARHIQALDTGGQWETVSVSGTIAAGANRWVGIAPRNTDLTPASVDVKACWLIHTSTPGRACWGGEAPVTCGGDRHTISTEGWPTESGEISVAFEVGALEGSARYIIDGRASGATTHSILLIESTGLLRLDLTAGTPNRGPMVPPGKHHVRLRWGDGRTQVFLDGAQVMDVQGTPTWHEAAYLGSRYAAPFDPPNGSIGSLRVRSFE